MTECNYNQNDAVEYYWYDDNEDKKLKGTISIVNKTDCSYQIQTENNEEHWVNDDDIITETNNFEKCFTDEYVIKINQLIHDTKKSGGRILYELLRKTNLDNNIDKACKEFADYFQNTFFFPSPPDDRFAIEENPKENPIKLSLSKSKPHEFKPHEIKPHESKPHEINVKYQRDASIESIVYMRGVIYTSTNPKYKQIYNPIYNQFIASFFPYTGICSLAQIVYDPITNKLIDTDKIEKKISQFIDFTNRTAGLLSPDNKPFECNMNLVLYCPFNQHIIVITMGSGSFFITIDNDKKCESEKHQKNDYVFGKSNKPTEYKNIIQIKKLEKEIRIVFTKDDLNLIQEDICAGIDANIPQNPEIFSMTIERQSTVFDEFRETKNMYYKTMLNIDDSNCNSWVLSKDIRNYIVNRPYTINFSLNENLLSHNEDLLNKFIYGTKLYKFPFDTSFIELGDTINVFVPSIYSEQPGTQQSETQQSETQQPGTQQPGTQQPGTHQSGTQQRIHIRAITWNMGGVTMSKEEWKQELLKHWKNQNPNRTQGPMENIDNINVIILITQEAPRDSMLHEAFAEVLNLNSNSNPNSNPNSNSNPWKHITKRLYGVVTTNFTIQTSIYYRPFGLYYISHIIEQSPTSICFKDNVVYDVAKKVVGCNKGSVAVAIKIDAGEKQFPLLAIGSHLSFGVKKLDKGYSKRTEEVQETLSGIYEPFRAKYRSNSSNIIAIWGGDLNYRNNEFVSTSHSKQELDQLTYAIETDKIFGAFTEPMKPQFLPTYKWYETTNKELPQECNLEQLQRQRSTYTSELFSNQKEVYDILSKKKEASKQFDINCYQTSVKKKKKHPGIAYNPSYPDRILVGNELNQIAYRSWAGLNTSILKSDHNLVFADYNYQLPKSTFKVVNIYLTRHGMSCSNLLKAVSGMMGKMESEYRMNDPQLIDYAIKQSKTAGQEVIGEINKNGQKPIDFIGASPLFRAIQTAYYMYVAEGESEGKSDANINKPIHVMPFIKEVGVTPTNQPALFDPASVIKKMQDIDKDVPDDLKIEYPADVNFVKNAPDWNKFIEYLRDNVLQIQSQQQQSQQQQSQQQQSRDQPEKNEYNIVIVSHGKFIRQHFKLDYKLRNNETLKLTYLYYSQNSQNEKFVLQKGPERFWQPQQKDSENISEKCKDNKCDNNSINKHC